MAQTLENAAKSPMPFGTAGIVLGALALIAALVAAYAGPFGPQQELGVALGEIAGDAIKSTIREVFNRPQPEAELRGFSIDDGIAIAIVVAGVVSILLGIVAAIRGERRAAIVGAAGLGIAALVFQFLAWVALVIAGAILILAVMTLIGAG